MAFKDKLIWMRKTSNKTQAQMAKASGVSLRTWKNYEQGKYDIPVYRLIRVAIYCCISLKAIFNDYMPQNEELKKIDSGKDNVNLKDNEN